MNLTINVTASAKFDIARFDFARFEGSTDRTKYVLWRTFNKVDNLNARVDTCSFQTRSYGHKDWSPVVGEEIEVLEDSIKIFGGIIVNVKETPEGANMQKYDVKCKDWTHTLDKRLVIERYTDKTVAEIITDILSTYATGFTETNVNCDIDIDSIAFNYITISQAIQMLAEQVNFSWYVDYDKDIHFFAKNVELAPYGLTDTNGKYIFKSLILKDDLSQLRNLVIIRGGEKLGNLRTENFVGNGIKKTFALGHKFSARPEVKIDGVATPVGLDFLDDDADYGVLWNFNEKYIRFVSAAGVGTPVTVTGTPYIPILIQVQDDASVGQYGQYEFRKTDKSIKTTDEAKQYAIAQLDAYKGTLKEGTFQTYVSGLRSGQVINVQSDIRRVNEDFIIQKVSLKMRGAEEGIWIITLATLRTVGIIDFLQRLLIGETKKITVGENEVLEKFYSDHLNITVTELIELHEEVKDQQSITVTEQIRRDPWVVEFCLAPYYPSSDSDPRRPMRLGVSSYVY